jgi:hypothetical protein
MVSADTVLKSVMIAGIAGYLLMLGYNPKKRDLYLYPALEILLFISISLFIWKLKIASMPVLLGFDFLGIFFVLQGIREYREEDEGRDKLRRFEDLRGVLVRAVLNRKQVALVLEDGSVHLFKPERLIKYGVEVAGHEETGERCYPLSKVKEVRELD